MDQNDRSELNGPKGLKWTKRTELDRKDQNRLNGPK